MVDLPGVLTGSLGAITSVPVEATELVTLTFSTMGSAASKADGLVEEESL